MKTKDPNCKACEENNNPNTIPRSDIASFASNNNMTGALSASFGTAVDMGTAGKLGKRFGGKSPSVLMKFIETPGSNKQKRNMSSDQKKKHIINSVGLGNFGLNSTLERGIIGSVGSARNGSSSFLKGNKTGSSLIAASALGIDVPGSNMLGIGPNDTPMFKLFKLAGFGLKMLCATLKNKQRGDYTSDTESALGLILSLGINLDLLARLKSIFDKLLNLKPNFGGFGIQDLNIANSLFNLCDWVENMEYGSDTIDTFRKTFANVSSNKGLTEVVGKKLISDGTYDTYASNDFGFDQQFKSIAGDIDMLKCDACNLGKTNLTVAQGNKDLVNLEFDARTGFKRERGYDEVKNESNDTSPILVKNDVIKKLGVADTLTEPVIAGSTKLEVKNAEQFPINSFAVIDEGTPQEECICVQGYGSLQLKEPMQNNHDAGATLSPPSSECKAFFDWGSDIESSEGIQFESASENIEFINEKIPTNNLSEELSNKTAIIKKDINVEDIKYSQKSIITQITESDDKLTKDKINTNLDVKPKSIKEQLGVKSESYEKEIETTLDETKVKNDIISKDKDIKAKNKEDLESEIKKDAISSHQVVEQKTSNIEYQSDSKSIVYDTYTDEEGNIKEDTYEKTGDSSFKKTKSTVRQTKPSGGPPVEPDATEVTSFHTGETITRDELNGTVLEDADMNAVGLLHPNDIENLKDTEEVEKTLADAEKVYDKIFAEEIEKTENLVLTEQTDGIIFGAQLPTLNGNQIVINSERVLISAKTQECGIFSKRKFFVSTDDEITMNAKQRIVLKTDMHTSIESPTIHLGVYTTRNHPSLKGDCTVWWLQDLCDWLSGHTHSDPFITTGSPTQQGSLSALRARAPTLLSERIFISG
tara:strand:+ start:3659 stop:6283 length:2625 start_codon:yes stop_codon:yes gene_type:complete